MLGILDYYEEDMQLFESWEDVFEYEYKNKLNIYFDNAEQVYLIKKEERIPIEFPRGEYLAYYFIKEFKEFWTSKSNEEQKLILFNTINQVYRE